MKKEKLIDKIELPPLPLYDGKESIIEYERRFNEYIDAIDKIKYNAILKFLNIWLSEYDIKLILRILKNQKYCQEKNIIKIC